MFHLIMCLVSLISKTFPYRFTLFSKCPVSFPIVPIVKMTKYGYSWTIKHISKDNLYFQLNLCVIIPKLLLSNLISVRVFNCFDSFIKTTKLQEFNIMHMEKTDMGLNVFWPVYIHVGVKRFTGTVLPAKGDRGVMLCLQIYQGFKIDRSLVY